MLTLHSGVPGVLRGLYYIHRKYGSIPWAELIYPSVKLARFGFAIDQDLLKNMHLVGTPSFLVYDDAWAVDFAPNGTLLGLGETLTRKRYAGLLETVATKGPDSFYSGPIADATIRAVQKANGSMTLEDLRNYTLLTRPTTEITYRDFRIISCSAPTGGPVALSALKVVEGYGGFGNISNVNLTTHRFDEAIRFAYGMV
jgi:gamma-glutamyltranspeptidase/glutathione hydrolase